MPLDHYGISVPAADLDAFAVFLETALAPVGFRELVRIPLPNGTSVVGMGEQPGPGSGIEPRAAAYFWLSAVPPELEEPQRKLLQLGHTCFVATSASQVRDFHEAALKANAKDDGPPGIRPTPFYLPDYYAAFVRDPVLNIKLEVVCRKGDI